MVEIALERQKVIDILKIICYYHTPIHPKFGPGLIQSNRTELGSEFKPEGKNSRTNLILIISLELLKNDQQVILASGVTDFTCSSNHCSQKPLRMIQSIRCERFSASHG